MSFISQVLHEEIELPGSTVKLRYLSSRTAGYKSLLKITMTQSTVPLNLIKVHLMVAVEGHLFQKSFQASPNLAYTFIWDKTDAYGQRVYGLSDAVGKSLSPCKGQAAQQNLCPSCTRPHPITKVQEFPRKLYVPSQCLSQGVNLADPNEWKSVDKTG